MPGAHKVVRCEQGSSPMFVLVCSGQTQLILFGALDGFQSVLVKPIHYRVPSVAIERPSLLRIPLTRSLHLRFETPRQGWS